MFPLFREILAMTANSRIRRTATDVEARCTDDDVDFVIDAVSCFNACSCDFGDGVVDNFDIVFAKRLQKTVSRGRSSTSDSKVFGNQHIANLGLRNQLIAHISFHEL